MHTRGAVAAACAAAAIACGTGPEPSLTLPRPRGEFRVGIPGTPVSLNPNLEVDEAVLSIARNLYNQLVATDEDGRLLPDLAQSWETSPDGLRYTFHLRRDARWHDGRPVTADDVRWTFGQVRRDGIARAVFTPIERVDAPDAGTVVIHLKHRWAPLLTDLAGFGLYVLPKHVYGSRDWRTHPAGRVPVGSGAFRFESWGSGEIVLAAQPGHFRRGPFVERLRFIIGTPDHLYMLLRQGRLDHMVARPPGEQLAHDSGAARVRFLPTLGRFYVALNLRRAPFDDVRVRRALSMATDRVTLVERALSGRGAPAFGWYTPAVEWAYHADVPAPRHEPRRAAALLAEAGRGRRLRGVITVVDLAPMREIALELQKQWRAAGFDTALDAVTMAEWPRRVLQSRDFDMTVLSGTWGPDPDTLRQRFGASGDQNFVGYANPAFDAAVETAARVGSLAERAASYRTAQEVMGEDVPYLPLAESVRAVAYRENVRGLPALEARGLVAPYDFRLVRVGEHP